MGTSVQSLSSLCHSARRQRQRHPLAPSPVPLLLLPSFPPSCGLSVACPAQPFNDGYHHPSLASAGLAQPAGSEHWHHSCSSRSLPAVLLPRSCLPWCSSIDLEQ